MVRCKIEKKTTDTCWHLHGCQTHFTVPSSICSVKCSHIFGKIVYIYRFFDDFTDFAVFFFLFFFGYAVTNSTNDVLNLLVYGPDWTFFLLNIVINSKCVLHFRWRSNSWNCDEPCIRYGEIGYGRKGVEIWLKTAMSFMDAP